MIIQIVLIIFLLFAVSRVILQLRQRHLNLPSFIFWGSVFITAIIGVLDPEITTEIAKLLGIGRGADVVVYFSLVTLFYLMFRLTIAIEELRYEITYIIRQISLRNVKKRHKKA